MVSSEFKRFFERYRDAADINVTPRKPTATGARTAKPKPPAKNRLQGRKTQRFFINIGRLDKINEGAIVRLICDRSGIRSNMIGQIDLKREFSFFEVEQRAAGRVHQSVKNARLDGRTVKIRPVVDKNRDDQTADRRDRPPKRRHRRAAAV